MTIHSKALKSKIMTLNTINQESPEAKNGKSDGRKEEKPKQDFPEAEKTPKVEDEKVKPQPETEGEEIEGIEHPHETSIPVATKSVNKGRL